MKAYLSNKSNEQRLLKLTITGSKSETNRLLVLQKLFSNLTIKNASESDDSLLLKKGLKACKDTVNIYHAGTAMRFLTTYFATVEGINIILTGSKRMQQRPIKILANILRDLGADIIYLKEEGFPPLQIRGKKILGGHVEIQADISSQYITALMLIAPSLSKGLILHLKGTITSRSYINMTHLLLRKIGVSCSFSENMIEIKPTKTIENNTIVIESDWSSASYFHSIVALSDDISITLKSFSKNSIQGDAVIQSIYRSFGVNTLFNTSERTITLLKSKEKLQAQVELDLSDTPDIAQTIAVTCLGLGIECKLTGLQTLKIKETDRLIALKTEIEKLGAKVSITKNSLELIPQGKIKEDCVIETYQDHRMAMAFAPLALKCPLIINEPNVVSKSFPSFWRAIEKAGISVEFK